MSLIEQLEAWVAERKKALVSSYHSHGLKASGNWEEELTSDVKQVGNKISVSIDGARYTEQMVRGRGASRPGGDGTLESIIREWIDDKGIQPKGDISKDTLAFLITRKIHRDGIRVPNKYNHGTFIDEVFYTTDGTLSQLQKICRNHFAKTLKTEITQGL